MAISTIFHRFVHPDATTELLSSVNRVPGYVSVVSSRNLIDVLFSWARFQARIDTPSALCNWNCTLPFGITTVSDGNTEEINSSHSGHLEDRSRINLPPRTKIILISLDGFNRAIISVGIRGKRTGRETRCVTEQGFQWTMQNDRRGNFNLWRGLSVTPTTQVRAELFVEIPLAICTQRNVRFPWFLNAR